MRPQLARLVLVAFFVSVLSLGFTHIAHGAQSITITPTSADVTVDPGGQYKGSIQVLNQADSPFDYKVYGAPFSVSSEDYDPNFTLIPGTTKVQDWIQVSSNKSHLDAYTTANIDYTIRVPKNAQPGGYYAAVFAETESKSLNTTGVITKQRVGAKLYIRVAGPVKEAGRVLSWQVAWLQFPPLVQAVRIENSGGVHFPATIHSTVRDVFGALKFDYNQRRQVLPGTIRKVGIVWDKTPAFGLFKVGGTAEYLGKTEPLATKYVLVANQTTRTLIMSFIVLIIVFMLVKWLIKRRKRKRASVAVDQPTSGD